jgi:hypothetical protein
MYGRLVALENMLGEAFVVQSEVPQRRFRDRPGIERIGQEDVGGGNLWTRKGTCLLELVSWAEYARKTGNAS